MEFLRLKTITKTDGITKGQLEDLKEEKDPFVGISREPYKSPNWHHVYGAMVALLVKESIDKGWGVPGITDMESIVNKAEAIATMESTAWANTHNI